MREILLQINQLTAV